VLGEVVSFGRPIHRLDNANQAKKCRIHRGVVAIAALMLISGLSKYTFEFTASQLMFG
jgi:hypothetical protein